MKLAIRGLYCFLLSFIGLPTYSAEVPIIVIGASLANGHVPFNYGVIAPVSGNSVAYGSYLDLGTELIRNGRFVINEAQAGATTFERWGCDAHERCGPGYWDAYETQLDRAIIRVKDPNDPSAPLHARFVYISLANDCLHPNAFGMPWYKTLPCTTQHFNQVADRFIAVGRKVIDNGLIPIFSKYPRYTDLDLPLFGDIFGFGWVLDERSYNEMRELFETRITRELPAAIYLNAWEKFAHIGDGIHPDAESVKNAVRLILEAIRQVDAVSPALDEIE